MIYNTSPAYSTANCAPAEMDTSKTSMVKPVGAPLILGSPVSDD